MSSTRTDRAPENGPATGHRPVRSFVRRAGRMTVAQARALRELWPQYGVTLAPETGVLDFGTLFGRVAPVVMEIGFGNGDALLALAAQDPGTSYVGVEVHEPGVGHCLLGIERAGVTNVRLVCHDAVELLRTHVADGSLAGVNLFFPDPWPKKRHHKRRIVQAPFVELVARRLAPGGRLQIATDWPPYAEHIETVMAGCAALLPDDAPVVRARTRFEARGERLGHPIWERAWRRA